MRRVQHVQRHGRFSLATQKLLFLSHRLNTSFPLTRRSELPSVRPRPPETSFSRLSAVSARVMVKLN
jgi:hypothetical protein